MYEDERVQRKNIGSESYSSYEICILHYFPVNKTENKAPPCYLHRLLHLFLLWCTVANADSVNTDTKWTTVPFLSLIELILSPVTVLVHTQGNKMVEALLRAFCGRVFIFLPAVQGEKTQLSRVEALEG